MTFETVIGLEVHVQLLTNSKIFSSASAAYGGDPNSYVDPVTLGLPGCLPVLNKRVVEYAVMIGLATKCEITKLNRFARKHYFYPDLPKGYQISQFEEPICERGSLEIDIEGVKRTIGIKRIHMEEDAGKNIHDIRTETSLVDLNRAGVPLLEIVSEPDLRSSEEAGAYLKTIRQIVRYLGISDGNMEEGSLRCDANISLRPEGQLTFGTRTEIKNLNSFKFVERALEYEVARQTALLKAGKPITQETLTFDSATGTTRSMRSKEESADYRYFPDPDLPPLIIDQRWINEIEESMPVLPQQAIDQLVSTYGLSEYDAKVLTAERINVDYFREAFLICNNAKLVSNWITSELFGLLNKTAKTIENSPVSAKQLGTLLKLLDEDTISGKIAKTVFAEMFETGKDPEAIINEKGIKQITGDEEILSLVRKVFDENTAQFAEFIGGNDRLKPYFVGQIMKASKGSANPVKVNELIDRELAARKKK